MVSLIKYWRKVSNRGGTKQMVKLQDDRFGGGRLSKSHITRSKLDSKPSSEESSSQDLPETFNQDDDEVMDDVLDEREFATSDNSLEAFSKEVLARLESDGVPSIPKNYELYFERILDEKSGDFKKNIMQLLELESGNEEEKRINFEKRVKAGFSHTKQILQIVATLYKNLKLMGNIAEKRGSELSSATNAVVAQNIAKTLEKDLNKLNGIISKQNTSLKELYRKSAEIISEIESEAVFDSKYGVYNRKYLLDELAKELKSVEVFGHESSLVMAKIPKAKAKSIGSEKGVALITRTISRLLLKTSRRSDIVSHYGEGVFGLLLKHTNLTSAQKASERLHDLVSATNFFYGDNEYTLDIAIGISKIDATKSVDDSVSCAFDALELADSSGSVYEVCSYDLDVNDDIDMVSLGEQLGDKTNIYISRQNSQKEVKNCYSIQCIFA
eukprot:TRINITY_DN21673_c0_g2_i1.p1 TRINITY_DN21673_c0_g2~~TRINITY_DN21673_c0_g2_i1.p1  ORF type:complete len:442 (-),score=21.36 TRINITY_DN21673_c0_g2_i1:1415-2740(-)